MRILLHSGLLALLVFAGACASPLVGLECLPGYTRCGDECFDFQTDFSHCGSCENSCLRGQTCGGGECLGEPLPDDDGGTDDGQTPMPDAGDGGMPDADAGEPVEPPPLCTGPGSPEDCVCGLGTIKCPESQCVGVGSDVNNCGGCGIECGADQFCVGGTCIDDCVPPLSLCGIDCFDLSNDPDNCGQCGMRCGTGLCGEGECRDDVAGHVVVIGHSFRQSRPSVDRILANAVGIPGGSLVRVLAFEGDAHPDSVTRADNAITNEGPTWEKLPATTLSVPFLLGVVDVLLIYAQLDTTDDVLQKTGEGWSAALDDFLERGGVVVLMDGGGTHGGTFQILQSAGIFNIVSRTERRATALELADRGDSVANGVSSPYAGPQQTVSFETTEERVVVRDMATLEPVVIHRAQ